MFRRSLLLVSSAAFLAACSDSSGPAAGQPNRVSLSFSTRASTTAAAARAANSAITIDIGAHSLVVDRAQVVLEEIEVEGGSTAGTACSDDSSTGLLRATARNGADDGPSHENEIENENECGEFETGPVVVDLPVGSTVATPIQADIPAGTYTELKLKVRSLHDDAPALLAANPELRNASIRVTGTFDGTPFTYTTPLEARFRMNFDTPLVVDQNGLNVTINVDLDSWFKDASGNLIDPRTANAGQANAATVDANIRSSFVAFRDDNRDGRRGGRDH